MFPLSGSSWLNSSRLFSFPTEKKVEICLFCHPSTPPLSQFSILYFWKCLEGTWCDHSLCQLMCFICSLFLNNTYQFLCHWRNRQSLVYNFLCSMITTWPTRELVKWEGEWRNVLWCPEHLHGNECWENMRLLFM